jgi:hypothetical protein
MPTLRTRKVTNKQLISVVDDAGSGQTVFEKKEDETAVPTES